MKKYWTLLKIVFIYNLTYRTRIILGLIQSFLTPMFMLIALVFTKPITTITLPQLFNYYLTISLVYSIVRSNIDEQINEMTANGEINNFLIKPVELWRYMLVKEFGEGLVTFLITLPISILSLTVLKFEVNLLSSIVLPAAILLGFFLYFNFSYLVGLLSFWLDEFWAVTNVKVVTINLLGGIILPYIFFPDWAVKILNASPFPYMANWVIKVLNNTWTWSEALCVLIWCLLLFGFVKLIERIAIAKYSFTAS